LLEQAGILEGRPGKPGRPSTFWGSHLNYFDNLTSEEWSGVVSEIYGLPEQYLRETLAVHNSESAEC